jgi:hypothetical protein
MQERKRGEGQRHDVHDMSDRVRQSDAWGAVHGMRGGTTSERESVNV